MGILLFGVLAVIIGVPRLFTKQPHHVPVLPEVEPVQSEMPPETVAALGAKEAQEALQCVLKLRARLENQGVKIWGAELLVTSYGQALALQARADSALDEERFDQALLGYREALEKLEQLSTSRPERIRRAISAGDEAFAQLDSELAQRHYQSALVVDSDNTEAQVGLQRANKLPQVLEWLSQGQTHERNEELDLARQMYEKAASLDERFQPAHDRLQEVEALILDRDFRRGMSAVLSSLDQEKTDQARESLDILKKLRPDMAADFGDLELQLKNIEQSVELRNLGEQGVRQEQAEEWENVVEIYSRALKIDANASFALAGKTRAEDALKLNQQVQAYLSNPSDLSAPEHLSYARNIHKEAVAKSEGTPKLREKAKKLGQLIDLYSKHVWVRFESDGFTEVLIHRVGRLGTFSERRLKMRPGKYTMRGVRSGHRDVLVSFEVRFADMETETVSIYCKEKI